MTFKSILLTTATTLGLSAATIAQNITNFTSIWYSTFSANCGGFGRAIIDNNDLVISGANWPSCPSGTTDQMITKISPTGNIIFQTVRAPGGDHDGYQAVVKLQNGNYGFFGQQNAQGTQYFDGFYTEFDLLGNEVSNNFFSIPGSSSGSDMLMLPNGNRIYTGNHGGGQNFIALTDPNFNQLNYQTFNVGGWNYSQLGIDAINNFVYAIGSESSTTSISIVKYDMSLNYIATYNITHTEPLLNYDIKMDGSDILLCGFKVISGQRFGSFYRMNTNGVITDSFVSENTSEYTAIEKYGNEIILAKSNLSGTNSISNELSTYHGSGSFGVAHLLNSSSPFVPFDLVLNGDTLYAVGAQGSGYWIGIPAVEKVFINAVTCSNNTSISPSTIQLQSGSNVSFAASTSDPSSSYIWQSDFGQGFQTLNNFGNYSGVNTSTLTIADVQLQNHAQPIRAVSIVGNCIDTSNVAVINILDTCITNVTIYDTLLTTVTDTLVINTVINGMNPPNNLNTLRVFPNPASTHITIDYGIFNAMSGYTLTIVNSIGQTVFTTPINQQTSYIDLSTWTGTGIYFVQLIDPQNNTIENRQIVIQ
jgi:hypothetical protein